MSPSNDTRIGSVWACHLLILIACFLGGCGMSRLAADPAALEQARAGATPLPENAWPTRWTQGLHPFVYAEPYPVDLAAPGLPDGRAKFDMLNVRRAMPMGPGLIAFSVRPSSLASEPREWERWESEDAIRGTRVFTYYSWDERERPVWDLPQGRCEKPDEMVSFQRAANRASITARFRLLMPEQGEPKGVILFVPPISAATLSLPVPRELLTRGWAVLSVDRIEVLQSTRSAMVIDVPWVKPPKRTGPKPKPPEPPPTAAGRWMGEWIRGDMADMSYAYQTGLEFAERAEPVLKGVPVVVLGTSLGAIFTPPLVARLGDRVQAAVLIGGGANMLRIMAETDPDVFNIGLLVGEGDVRLTPERGKKWSEAYLANNPLDPVHTAPSLARIPTLMIHAERDGLVPHQYGDLLWERAGKPERWTVDSGHIWLFVTLKDRATQIADWIDQHVPARDASGAP